MMNGTRCEVCGDFVYARRVPGDVDPSGFICDDCRTDNRSVELDEPEHSPLEATVVTPSQNLLDL